MNADYQLNISVKATPQKVFSCINKVQAWWTSDLEGNTDKLNDIFTVHFGETFITLKIVELIPDKKIQWHVVDCNKHWLKNRKEWKDTHIHWEISTENETTKMQFTHVGLVPGIECFDVCEKAWMGYLQQDLKELIHSEKG